MLRSALVRALLAALILAPAGACRDGCRPDRPQAPRVESRTPSPGP